MPSHTATLAKDFLNRSNRLEVTRNKVEALLLRGGINIEDIEQVYNGLFLDVFTEFEALIEELFLGLLTGKLYYTKISNLRSVKIVPASMARNILFGERPYLDWLPYEKYTLPRAKLFFRNGEPFSLLSDDQRGSLREYHIIRNALAHKSDSARIKFDNLIQNLTLLPSERTPAGYLRSKPQGSETQYRIAIVELGRIANVLCL